MKKLIYVFNSSWLCNLIFLLVTITLLCEDCNGRKHKLVTKLSEIDKAKDAEVVQSQSQSKNKHPLHIAKESKLKKKAKIDATGGRRQMINFPETIVDPSLSPNRINVNLNSPVPLANSPYVYSPHTNVLKASHYKKVHHSGVHVAPINQYVYKADGINEAFPVYSNGRTAAETGHIIGKGPLVVGNTVTEELAGSPSVVENNANINHQVLIAEQQELALSQGSQASLGQVANTGYRPAYYGANISPYNAFYPGYNQGQVSSVPANNLNKLADVGVKPLPFVTNRIVTDNKGIPVQIPPVLPPNYVQYQVRPGLQPIPQIPALTLEHQVPSPYPEANVPIQTAFPNQGVYPFAPPTSEFISSKNTVTPSEIATTVPGYSVNGQELLGDQIEKADHVIPLSNENEMREYSGEEETEFVEDIPIKIHHRKKKRKIIRIQKARCIPNPCKNGGACTALEHGYDCACLVGYKGLHCEQKNHCQPNPCENEGSCYELSSGYQCQCNSGFYGDICQHYEK